MHADDCTPAADAGSSNHHHGRSVLPAPGWEQEQAIQRERLVALSAMAAGLTLDFNHTLALIIGNCELALSHLWDPNGGVRASQLLSSVIGSAQGAATMFNRLRDFARPAEHNQPRQVINLNSLVEQVAAVAHARWCAQTPYRNVPIDLSVDLDPDLPPLTGNVGELREMLLCLVSNSLEAMPAGGGTICLRTRAEAGGIVLEVADNGVGMGEETRRYCMEPFYTTKQEVGSGLGLATVYGTVGRHGGAIDWQSAPGVGTTFTVSLPLNGFEMAANQGSSDDEADAQPAVASAVPENLRILVVDDQPVLCEILSEYLTGDGHRVETAGDGHEALAKFRGAGAGAFQLVITDQIMPGLAGLELAGVIKAEAPEVRVILLTGYGTLLASRGGTHSIDGFIDKPASLNTLRCALAAVMGSVQGV